MISVQMMEKVQQRDVEDMDVAQAGGCRFDPELMDGDVPELPVEDPFAVVYDKERALFERYGWNYDSPELRRGLHHLAAERRRIESLQGNIDSARSLTLCSYLFLNPEDESSQAVLEELIERIEGSGSRGKKDIERVNKYRERLSGQLSPEGVDRTEARREEVRELLDELHDRMVLAKIKETIGNIYRRLKLAYMG